MDNALQRNVQHKSTVDNALQGNVQHKSTASHSKEMYSTNLQHMVWRIVSFFSPLLRGGQIGKNFDATYHDVTAVKLDSRPHYDCVLRTQLPLLRKSHSSPLAPRFEKRVRTSQRTVYDENRRVRMGERSHEIV